MSETHTIVVRFPEELNPRYSAATAFYGGQVVAVSFDGNRLAVADELEEALDACLDLLEAISPVEGDTTRKARAALARARGGS
mgnify:CR=1 FL=1